MLYVIKQSVIPTFLNYWRLRYISKEARSYFIKSKITLKTARRQTNASNSKEKKTANDSKLKTKKLKITEVEKYFMSNEDLVKIKDLIPSRFFKTNRTIPDDLFLADHKVAKEIAATLIPHILNSDKFLIETNPGIGLLTKELLNAGVSKIQVYESNVQFRVQIIKLGSEYPGRITQYDTDFFLLWKLSYQDRHDNGDRVKKMLSNVKTKEWSEDPSMTIIGTLTSSNFIRYLTLSLIFQFGIMTRGRCEMYICIPPTLYSQLTAGPESGYVLYLASSVLFQLLFDFEILRKVPTKAFLPWYNNSSSSKMYPHLADFDSLYLTRIAFKRELPVPSDRLQHLWYFVKFLMLSRKQRIIPRLEKWIPGCGAQFIVKNSQDSQNKYNFCEDFNIYTEVGHLTATQMLNLYKEFSNLPEYLESPFIASMETMLLKMESSQAIEEQIRTLQKVVQNQEDESTTVDIVSEKEKHLNCETENR